MFRNLPRRMVLTTTTAPAATAPAGAGPSVAYTLPPGLFGRLSASILDLLLGLPPGLFIIEFLASAEASPDKHWLGYLIYLLVYLAALGLAALQGGSPGKWLLRQRLITTRPGSFPVSKVIARTIVVALMGTGEPYAVEAPVGTAPSVVYRIVAPVDTVDRTRENAVVYAPPG